MTQSGTLWLRTGSLKIRLLELRGRLIAGLVIDSETSVTVLSEPNSHRNVLFADPQHVLFGGRGLGFDLQICGWRRVSCTRQTWRLRPCRTLLSNYPEIVLLTFTVVRFVLFYNCFKKYFFRFIYISVYCFIYISVYCFIYISVYCFIYISVYFSVLFSNLSK